MKFGDELEVRLVDSSGHTYYTEPFKLREYLMYSDLESTLRDFKEGAESALEDIRRDVKINEQTKGLDDFTLIHSLNTRGYNVTKRDNL